jgi:hypothetical protein
MFNIHKVREDWEDMPTARALQEVIDRTGTTDPDELKELTGLSKEQIGRYRLILSLPKRYQKLIDDQKLPMNFFVELERNVIKPLERSRKQLSTEFTASRLRTAFVAKRDAGALKDVIDLRLVKPIIDRAAIDAGTPEDPSVLDSFLRDLFTQKTATIDEIYDASVSFAVESDKLAEQAAQLPTAFQQMLARASDEQERNAVVQTLRETRDALSAVLSEHE